MTSTSLTYISSLLLICSSIVYLTNRSKLKIFEYLPAIVIIYFVIVLLSIFGLWHTSSIEIKQTKTSLEGLILPIMLFLMLIRCDIRMYLNWVESCQETRLLLHSKWVRDINTAPPVDTRTAPLFV